MGVRRGVLAGFAVAVLAVGLLRFALTVSGVPNHLTRLASMTVVLLAGCVYFGALRLPWRDLVVVSYVLILPYMLVELAAIGYTWGTGRPSIFHAPEYSFGLSPAAHFWGHLVGGLTWEPLALFLLMLLVRFVASRIRPAAVTVVLWSSVGLLVAIGTVAVAGRTLWLSDLATRSVPVRNQVLVSAAVEDPLAAGRAEEARQFDRRFSDHPATTLLHVIPGGVYLVLAPLQFVARLRARHPRLHRWSGRLLVALAAVTGVTGLFFGLFVPFGGALEGAAVALFGAWILYSLARAVAAIRRRQVALHREWMIRAFAVGLGISTIRLIGPPLDLAFTAAGVGAREMFAAALWAGWLLTVAVAEAWIRQTRPRLVRAMAGAA